MVGRYPLILIVLWEFCLSKTIKKLENLRWRVLTVYLSIFPSLRCSFGWHVKVSERSVYLLRIFFLVMLLTFSELANNLKVSQKIFWSHPFPVVCNPICVPLRKFLHKANARRDNARATRNLNSRVPLWPMNPTYRFIRIFELTEAPFQRKTLFLLVTGKAILVGKRFLLFLTFLNF